MKIKTKEFFLSISLLGSICHCLISPSHGMEEDDRDEKLPLLKGKQSLESISLNSDHIYSTVKNLAEGIEAIKIQSQQRREAMIKFDETLTKNIEKQESMDKVFSLLTKPQGIHSLTFCNGELTDVDAPQVANILSQKKPLINVSLEKNKLTSVSLKCLIPALNLHPHLEELNLDYNLIDNNGGKALLAFLEKKTSLREISLYRNPVNEEIQRSIRKICSLRIKPQDIDSLTFCSCGLSDEDAPQVANLLSQASDLRECMLSDNKFTSQSLKHILPALNSHPKLKILVLEENLIDDAGGKELLYFMKAKDSLKRICLRGNHVSKSIEQSINKIGSLRSTCSNIYSYTFLDCGFTDEDAPQVATLLSQATPLTEVNLGKNKFTSESLKHILPALKFYSDLEILNFESNLIDDNGVKELFTFLETNSSLKKIYLGGNNLTQDVEKINEKFDAQKEKYNSSMWSQVCQLF